MPLIHMRINTNVLDPQLVAFCSGCDFWKSFGFWSDFLERFQIYR
jgi:hypothetical protein